MSVRADNIVEAQRTLRRRYDSYIKTHTEIERPVEFGEASEYGPLSPSHDGRRSSHHKCRSHTPGDAAVSDAAGFFLKVLCLLIDV